MPDILARIGASRRARIDRAMAETPAHVLRERLGSPPPAGRFETALRRRQAADPMHVIAEIKRASPSKGVLREDVDPLAIAKAYEAGGASAISLVTEPDHFGGDIGWIDRVRPVVRLPILLKDFVIDSYQLLDAAVRGADAVLLLVPMLSEIQLQRLISEAKLLGLDALVEVHAAEELNLALRAGATLIGVNNRNLHTFEVDPGTAQTLLPKIPAMVTAVAESGLSTPEDLARLRATRCDAVLIGEAFMTSASPGETLRTLVAAARG